MSRPFAVKVTAKKSGSGAKSLYVLLPKKIVEQLNIHEGEIFFIEVKDENTIVLKRVRPPE